MPWHGRAGGVDGALGLDGVAKRAHGAQVARVVLGMAGQDAARISFAHVGGASLDVEASSRGVGHDLVGVDGGGLARVEMVDAPALLAVLEGVFLSPSAAHDRDETLGGERGAGEDIDLPLVGKEDRDAPDATAAFPQVGASVDEVKRFVVERHRLREGGARQDRVRRALVGDEFASLLAQRSHGLGERSAAIEGDEHAVIGTDDGAEVIDDGQEPVRQRVVRGNVDAEERAALLIMHVVVGDAGSDALVLHAPALADDALARVGPQVVVDVEDAALALGELAIGVEVRAHHREVHEDAAEIGGERVHQLAQRLAGASSAA